MTESTTTGGAEAPKTIARGTFPANPFDKPCYDVTVSEVEENLIDYLHSERRGLPLMLTIDDAETAADRLQDMTAEEMTAEAQLAIAARQALCKALTGYIAEVLVDDSFRDPDGWLPPVRRAVFRSKQRPE